MIAVLDRALLTAAAAFVVGLLATVTAGVVSRALNQPLAWTDEAAGYLMVWTACLGWMVATRRGAHIRIRYVLDRLPRPLHLGTEAAIQAGLLVLGAMVAFHGVDLVRRNADIEAVALPIAAACLYVPLLPAGALTALQALVDLAALRRHKAAAR